MKIALDQCGPNVCQNTPIFGTSIRPVNVQYLRSMSHVWCYWTYFASELVDRKKFMKYSNIHHIWAILMKIALGQCGPNVCQITPIFGTSIWPVNVQYLRSMSHVWCYWTYFASEIVDRKKFMKYCNIHHIWAILMKIALGQCCTNACQNTPFLGTQFYL